MSVNANDSWESPEEFLSNIVPVVRNLQLVFLLLVAVSALTLNVLVTTVAWKNRRMDFEEMANSAAIAVLDITWILLVHPIAIFAIISKSWPSEKIFCTITGSFNLCVVLLRNQLVGLALLDKFCSVFSPFKYPRYRRKIIRILWTFAVLFALVYAILPVVVQKAGRYSFYSAYAACFLAAACPKPPCYVHVAVMATHWITFWAVLPTVLFIAMYVKAKMLSAREQPVMGTFAADLPIQTTSTAQSVGKTDSASLSSSFFSGTLPHNGRTSVANYAPKPTNTATTVFLYVAVYVGCLLPIAIHFGSYRLGFDTAGATTQTELVTMIGFICGDINILLTVLDPLIILKNKRTRGSIWCC